MERTQYKPKQTFGCDYCGWLGPGAHVCEVVRKVGYATIDDLGNFMSRNLESSSIQIRFEEVHRD